MSKEKIRNIVGDICVLLLAILVNILAIPVIVYVEGIQSDWGKKFPIETDDIVRRIFIAIIGAGVQIGLITSILY